MYAHTCNLQKDVEAPSEPQQPAEQLASKQQEPQQKLSFSNPSDRLFEQLSNKLMPIDACSLTVTGATNGAPLSSRGASSGRASSARVSHSAEPSPRCVEWMPQACSVFAYACMRVQRRENTWQGDGAMLMAQSSSWQAAHLRARARAYTHTLTAPPTQLVPYPLSFPAAPAYSTGCTPMRSTCARSRRLSARWRRPRSRLRCSQHAPP